MKSRKIETEKITSLVSQIKSAEKIISWLWPLARLIFWTCFAWWKKFHHSNAFKKTPRSWPESRNYYLHVFSILRAKKGRFSHRKQGVKSVFLPHVKKKVKYRNSQPVFFLDLEIDVQKKNMLRISVLYCFLDLDFD